MRPTLLSRALVTGTLALALAPGVAAIETATFGVEPAIRTTGESGLPLPLDAHGKGVAEIRVWNKTAEPLVLELSTAPARIGADGVPELGGPPEPATWIRPGQARLELGAHESRIVRVEARMPADAREGQASAAILVRPAVRPGTEPAVLEQIGLVVRPAAAVETATTGPSGTAIPWWALLLAVAGLLFTGPFLARAIRRREWTHNRSTNALSAAAR